MNSQATKYDLDYVAWAESTAHLLEQQKFDQLDLENLMVKVLDLSRRERQALYSNLKILLLHLLKWQFQPEQPSRSWRASIIEHRQRIQKQLRDSPSLKPYLTEILTDCYTDATALAAAETGLMLAQFPPDCPYTTTETLNADQWPGTHE